MLLIPIGKIEIVNGSWKVVLPDRFELSTSPLPMECSTPELRQRTYEFTFKFWRHNAIGLTYKASLFDDVKYLRYRKINDP